MGSSQVELSVSNLFLAIILYNLQDLQRSFVKVVLTTFVCRLLLDTKLLEVILPLLEQLDVSASCAHE